MPGMKARRPVLLPRQLAARGVSAPNSTTFWHRMETKGGRWRWRFGSRPSRSGVRQGMAGRFR